MPPTRPNRPRTAPAADPETVVEPAAVSRPARARPSASRLVPLNAATLNITDDTPPVSAVSVNLMGVLYEVTPPKSAAAMRIAWLAADPRSDPDEVFAALESWIDKAFGDQSDDVRRRMYEDDSDPLDFPHIMTLIQRLIERDSALPTTRR